MRHNHPRQQEIDAKMHLERIKQLASRLNPNEDLPVLLYQDVEWIVENQMTERLRTTMDTWRLGQDAVNVLLGFICEAGYRLSLISTGKGDTGRFTAIPFALLLTIGFEGEGRAPSEVPQFVDTIVERKILRSLLGLGEGTSLIIDPRLYPPDASEILEESTVRRYLKNALQVHQGKKTELPPLCQIRKTLPALQANTVIVDTPTQMNHRILCGVIIAPESTGNVLEETLFTARLPMELETLLEQEIAPLLKAPQCTVTMYPVLLELWQVPSCAYYQNRELLMNTLLSWAWEDVPSQLRGQPADVYVSRHGTDGQATEFRIGAYVHPSTDDKPFWSHVWEINSLYEDTENTREVLAHVGTEIKAKVTLIEELFPDDRCDCCNRRTFVSPQTMPRSAKPKLTLLN